MESQEIYSDDNSYYSGQDSDYVYDGHDNYSDGGNSYDWRNVKWFPCLHSLM